MVIASLRSSEAPAKRGCDRSRVGFLERGVIDKVSLLLRSCSVIVIGVEILCNRRLHLVGVTVEVYFAEGGSLVSRFSAEKF